MTDNREALPIVEKLMRFAATGRERRSNVAINGYHADTFDEAAAVITELYEALRKTRIALWAIEDSAVESGFDKLGDIIADQLVAANAAIELAEAQS